jgi:4-amino-4-deoxy-L-arabinose transferase-like glycosyltransferase
MLLGLSLGLLAIAGVCLARATGSPEESRATRAVRVMLWAFAILVVTEATLGMSGRLDARSSLVALATVALALAVGMRRLARRPASGGREREPLTVLDVACVFALAAVVLLRAWAGFSKTTFLYDTLSYHLHVPATWLADRRVEIVPAVFGDPSSAYAPSNLELWFAFLMAPLHSDYLAGTGQVAFAALAALAIVAAVREAGGRRTAALAAALAFLLVPEVWQQARTAMTDLGLAALLLASLPFSLRAARGPGPGAGDLLTAAAALGLAVGTKYVGLPLSLPFALAAGLSSRSGRPRPRALVAAAGVVFATGGFWYLRNALATGNPFYPVATLGLPGLTDRAAMRAWIYHLPIGHLGALGEMIGAAGFGFVLVAAVAIVWRRLLPEAGLLLALVAVFWLWIPYQESRFLFAAFGVAAVAIGRATGPLSAAAPLDWRLAVVLAGLVEYSAPERWLIVPVGALGAATAIGWRHLPDRARRSLRSMPTVGLGALLVAAAVALTIGLDRYRARDPGYAVGTGLDDAWAWFHVNVRGARVAYAGTNLCFPLAGRDLANRVTYVNVAGGPGDQLHDFGRRSPPPGRTATPESAPYRDGASFDAWWRNLSAARADVLFVAALDEIVARNVAADGDGFPVERAWADAHPTQFHLRYASPDARVYGIAPP